jgi:predicted phosphoribosyltransferase
MEIAAAIKADLDIIVCRKLASPLNPEGGLGAVADDGTAVINEEIIKRDGLTREQIEFELESVKQTVRQRRLKYKGNLPSSRLTGKTAIIVDDGLASGITMSVAVESVKHRLAGSVVVAVPVASAAGYRRVAQAADKIVTCAVANMSRFFLADFFRTWRDISDDEVVHYLDQWKKRLQF